METKDPLEISTHTLDDWFILAAIDMDSADILLEYHLRHEEPAFFGSFVNVQTLKAKKFLLVDRLPEFLQQMRFYFFISDIESITEKVEFPYFLNIEVFGNILPTLVHFLNEFKSWRYHCDHIAQIDGVTFQVLPETDILFNGFFNLLLDMIKSILRRDQILYIQTPII